MIAELILSAVCSGPACVEKAVTREVHRTKVVARTVEPVQKVVQRVRHREWKLIRRWR